MLILSIQTSLSAGKLAFPKPIRVVVLSEEPISELGQILSQFDDMEMNISAHTTRGPSLTFSFGFSGVIYFYPWASGARVLLRLDLSEVLYRHAALPIT